MKACDKANTVVQRRPYSVTGSRAVKSLFMANRDCSYYKYCKYSYTSMQGWELNILKLVSTPRSSLCLYIKSHFLVCHTL